MSTLNSNGILSAAETVFNAGRLPGEGNIDPKFRLKKLVDARNQFTRLTKRERSAALFIAAVQLHPELGLMTGRVLDCFEGFVDARS